MKAVRVRGILLDGHKGAAVEVPFDPAERWGQPAVPLEPGRRGHRVIATLAGVRFESAVVPRARRFFVLVDTQTCRTAGMDVGDKVTLSLTPA
jgi:hypothetical protein